MAGVLKGVGVGGWGGGLVKSVDQFSELAATAGGKYEGGSQGSGEGVKGHKSNVLHIAGAGRGETSYFLPPSCDCI